MIRLLQERGRLTTTIYLLSLSLFCFLLSIFRVFISETRGYLFLNWNLFLALIPWLLTSIAILWKMQSRIAVLLILAVWLLFFPNSLYIFTDLIHLRAMQDAPVWLDLIIVLSFAWAGLCFGFVSLMDIEFFLRTRFKAGGKFVILLSVCMVYLAAFGIYLGRFLRWNSWDLLGNPAALLNDIVDPFTDPLNNLTFWGFTVLMGTLLNFMYFGFRFISAGTSSAASGR